MKRVWTGIAAIAMVMALGLSTEAQADPRGAGGRIYLGGFGVGQNGEHGGGGLIGYQGFWGGGKGRTVQGFWDVELMTYRLGANAAWPVLTVDGGMRWTPFPKLPVQPFLKANVGLSLLVIVPVPSIGLGIGASVPLGDEFAVDLTLGGRKALNYLDVNRSLDIGSMEVGLRF